jgi:hypothetical protein
LVAHGHVTGQQAFGGGPHEADPRSPAASGRR